MLLLFTYIYTSETTSTS